MDHASVVALTKAKAAAPPVKPLTGRTGSERDADEARILLGQTQNPQRNAGGRGLGLPQLGDRRGSRQQRSTGKRKIGRASCRERVGQYVYVTVVAVSLNKKTNRDNETKTTL